MPIRRWSVLMCAFITGLACAQAPEIRLWPGKAPGTEQWTLPETVTTSAGGTRILSNVSDPTLTVYLPDAARATGAAVVIAPGGALRFLAMGTDGEPVARWLNSKGIAAFVLKYRTLQMTPERQAEMAAPPGMAGGGRRELQIRNGNANPAPDDAGLAQVLQMGIADAQAALRLVRREAKQWHVDPARVGMMGFSAGGGVMLGAALTPDKTEASPDFLVSVYGPSLMDVNPPPHAPPLFIVVGSGHFNVTNGSIALFQQWKAAGKSAELHVYDGVTGGFNMNSQGRPVDGWPDRLLDWMVARQLTAPR